MNNKRYLNVKHNLEAFLNQNLTSEQLLAFLQQQQEEIEYGAAQAKAVQMPPEALEDFAEELELGFEGISLWEEGLAGLIETVSSSHPENFQPYLDLCWQGSIKLDQAAQANHNNQVAAESLMMESATDSQF